MVRARAAPAAAGAERRGTRPDLVDLAADVGVGRSPSARDLAGCRPDRRARTNHLIELPFSSLPSRVIAFALLTPAH
jgi:hypothetical protein